MTLKSPIPVMVNGLPGNVARIMAAAAAKDPRFALIPYSLTGPDIEDASIRVDGHDITLVRPDLQQKTLKAIQETAGRLGNDTRFIAVDYTHPTAVNANAEFYTRNQIPFVMGTTGGDRKHLEKTVQSGQAPAVIAPNMAKQIVGLQAMLNYAAQTFPKLFKGYSLEVKESHQQGKADTSGTAKAMVGYFNDLGLDFKVDQIQQVRNPEIQEKEWGIPREHLDGHGWHTYTLTAEDGSSLFEFKHNINGREIYVSGTFDAVLFLWEKLGQTDPDRNLFTMIDVMTQT